MPATVAVGALGHSRVADAAAHSTTADIRVALAEPATAQPATAPAVATAADAAAAEPEPSSALALAAVAEPAAAVAVAAEPEPSSAGALVPTAVACLRGLDCDQWLGALRTRRHLPRHRLVRV